MAVEEEVVCRYFNSFRNVLLKEFSNFEKKGPGFNFEDWNTHNNL